MNEIIAKALEKIKQANPLMYAASGAEDIVKMRLEKVYDALAETSYFKKIQDRSSQTKLLVLVAAFTGNAYLKIHMKSNTPGSSFLKGIITDSFPEIGQRLLNGKSSSNPEEQEVIDLVRQPDKGGMTRYSPKAEEKKKSGPGFFSGTSALLKGKMQKYIDNDGGK